MSTSFRSECANVILPQMTMSLPLCSLSLVISSKTLSLRIIAGSQPPDGASFSLVETTNFEREPILSVNASACSLDPGRYPVKICGSWRLRAWYRQYAECLGVLNKAFVSFDGVFRLKVHPAVHVRGKINFLI